MPSISGFCERSLPWERVKNSQSNFHTTKNNTLFSAKGKVFKLKRNCSFLYNFLNIFITSHIISYCVLNVIQASCKHLSEVNLPSHSSLSQLPDKQRLSDDDHKRDNNCDKRMVICSCTFILIKGITGRQRYYLRRRFRTETILRFHAVTRCISRQTTGGTKTSVQQSSPHKGTTRKWHVLPSPPALFRALASSFSTDRLPRAKGRAREVAS